ncbi:MAG: hypothetical protein U9R19_18905, partial [Bacteroidota bacterium]|nr:hypothetical protein [Bacteroidota bacterium]
MKSLIKTIVFFFFLITIQSASFAQFTSAGTEFCFSMLQNRIDQNGAPTNCLLSEVNVRFVVSNNSNTSAWIEIDFSGNNINYMIDNVLHITSPTSNVHQFWIGPDQAEMIEIVPTSSVTYNDPCPGAGQTTCLDIRQAILMNNGQVQSKVYWVKSLNNIDVTVYAESHQGGGRDASLILPVQSLGYNYYAVSVEPSPLEYATVHYGGNLGGPSEIGIVSPHDNCEIFFKLPPTVPLTQAATSNVDGTNNNTITGGGVTHTIVLNKGEAYQIQSDNFDLTGTRIWSFDRAFAVFSGNMSIDIIANSGYSAYGYDQVYAQLFPVKNWGNSYIVTPIPNNQDDLIKIVALEDSTEVIVNGSSLGFINGGENIEFTLINGTSAFIESNMPSILVSQFSKSSHYSNGSHQNYDPSLLVVPTLFQTIEEITFSVLPEIDFSNPNCNNNIKKDYVSIIAHNTETSLVMIDDFVNPPYLVQNFPSIHTVWTTITGNTDYSYCILDVSNNSITAAVPYHLYMSGAANFGFNAIVHGLDCAEAYAYAAGINIIVDSLSTLAVSFSNSAGSCVGDTIAFYLSANLPVDSVHWDFGDTLSGINNTSGFQNPVHIFVEEGLHEVILIAYSGNMTDTFSQSIFISALPDFSFLQDTLYDSVFPAELNASTPGCSYLWSDGSTAETLWVTSGGTFYVTVTNASGCSVSDSIFVVNLGTIYSIRNTKLQVFPNPASDMLNIKLNNGSIW